MFGINLDCTSNQAAIRFLDQTWWCSACAPNADQPLSESTISGRAGFSATSGCSARMAERFRGTTKAVAAATAAASRTSRYQFQETKLKPKHGNTKCFEVQIVSPGSLSNLARAAHAWLHVAATAEWRFGLDLVFSCNCAENNIQCSVNICCRLLTVAWMVPYKW